MGLQPIPPITKLDEKSAQDLVFAINDRLAQLDSDKIGDGLSLTGAVPVESNLSNDLQLGEGVYFEISTPQACTITGFAGGYNNRRALVKNIGTTTMTLAHESGSSGDANRLKTRTATSVSLGANDIVELLYSAKFQRWIVLTNLL